MFGVLAPWNMQQALEIDAANGDTKWADAVAVEMSMINSYDTFTDKGKGYKPSRDYKKIRVHIVFACKHDGRRKARLVAGGHLTDAPIDSVIPALFHCAECGSSHSWRNLMVIKLGLPTSVMHIWNHTPKRRHASLQVLNLATLKATRSL